MDVTWDPAFTNNNYTVQVMIADEERKLRVKALSMKPDGAGLTITVENHGATSASGTLHVAAKKD